MLLSEREPTSGRMGEVCGLLKRHDGAIAATGDPLASSWRERTTCRTTDSSPVHGCPFSATWIPRTEPPAVASVGSKDDSYDNALARRSTACSWPSASATRALGRNHRRRARRRRVRRLVQQPTPPRRARPRPARTRPSKPGHRGHGTRTTHEARESTLYETRRLTPARGAAKAPLRMISRRGLRPLAVP